MCVDVWCSVWFPFWSIFLLFFIQRQSSDRPVLCGIKWTFKSRGNNEKTLAIYQKGMYNEYIHLFNRHRVYYLWTIIFAFWKCLLLICMLLNSIKICTYPFFSYAYVVGLTNTTHCVFFFEPFCGNLNLSSQHFNFRKIENTAMYSNKEIRDKLGNSSSPSRIEIINRAFN